MNASDIVASLVFGLSIPLALAPLLRVLAGERWPHPDGSLGLSGGLFGFGLALLCGPGLLAEQLIAARREDAIAKEDLILGLVALLGWALVYGYVALTLLSA